MAAAVGLKNGRWGLPGSLRSLIKHGALAAGAAAMSAIENLGDPAIRDGLSWYLAVAESEPPNRKVAFGGPGCAGDVAQPCCSQV
jgi:hypothetical protein